MFSTVYELYISYITIYEFKLTPAYTSTFCHIIKKKLFYECSFNQENFIHPFKVKIQIHGKQLNTSLLPFIYSLSELFRKQIQNQGLSLLKHV